MKIAFIGAGNVAHHLSIEFHQAGHEIISIYNRKVSHAEALADKLPDTKATDDLDFSESEAELFILSVSDNAIDDILSKAVWPENAQIVHTAGAKSLTSLKEALHLYSDVSVRAGVLYPLQTISKAANIDWKQTPFCIEGDSEEVEEELIDLARTISDEVYLVNSEERLKLHVAAVFANNFPNHLWALTQDLLAEHNLDFDLLKPLLKETVKKALESDHPADIQTGPARRGDDQTMQTHLKVLEEHPMLARIYSTLSDSIMQWYL